LSTQAEHPLPAANHAVSDQVPSSLCTSVVPPAAIIVP
jgi:hypothetical protein